MVVGRGLPNTDPTTMGQVGGVCGWRRVPLSGHLQRPPPKRWSLLVWSALLAHGGHNEAGGHHGTLPVRRPTHAARERTRPTHTTTHAAIARYTPHCSSTPPPPLPALVVHRPPLSTIAIAPALSRSAPPTTLAASVSAVSATHATVVAVRTSSHHLVLSTTCACR